MNFIKQIEVGSDEEKFAKDALFSRHPAMEDWNQPGRFVCYG